MTMTQTTPGTADSFDWDFESTQPATAATAPRTRRTAPRPAHRNFPGNAALRAIAACIRADVPVIIWGEPGTAKTASLTAMANAWGYHTEVIIGSIRDTTDMLGLPVESDGQVVYAPPAWAKTVNAADKALILWDEFTTGGAIMNAMLRVIQEREVGEYQLGDHVRMVAIANPPECAVNGIELPPPMANRFIHIDWQFDVDMWLDGLATNFVDAPTHTLGSITVDATPEQRLWVTSLVMGYLRSNPSVIKPGLPKSAEQQSGAWASPRSWTNLMNVLFHIDPSDNTAIAKVAAGAVGSGPGQAFMAYVNAVGLFDPEEVLNNPTVVDWTDSRRVDRLFALTMAVSTLAISRGDIPTWAKAMDVLTECHRQGRHDTPVIALQDLLKHRPDRATITAEQRERFSDYIV